MKCRGRSARSDCEQYLAFSPCLAHSCGRRALGGSGAAPCIANFKNPLSHASHASHTSHLQLASCEAPRFAKRFSGSIQSAKPLVRAQECARTGQARRRFAARQKIGGWARFAARPRKWGCALRVVKRRPLFNDSVVKDQARQPEGLGRIPGVEVTLRLAGITCPLIFQARVFGGCVALCLKFFSSFFRRR